MKHIYLLLIVALSFMGCSSKDEYANVQPQLVVGKSLANFQTKDQNDNPKTIPEDTKIVIFSFSKATGHTCKEFLEEKPESFLSQHHAVYVADVSAAPSLIKSMFILPGLRDLKFSVLLIDDEATSAKFSKGFNEEDIVIVFLDDKKISKVQKVHSKEELEALFAH